MVTVALIFFLSCILLITYTYAIYPLVLAFMGLFKREKHVVDDNYIPTVALIISAYNEEKIIREKLENSLGLDYPKDRLKIVVASDGSDDLTNEIVSEYTGDRVVLKSFERRQGKSATLNRAILGLEEDILVFSDANAFYEKDAIRKLVRNFADPETGCVVGRLIYLTNHSYVGRGESLYWRYESLLNKLESKLGSVLVGTGTIFAIRRELFSPVISSVANDFQLPAVVASKGYAVVYEPEAIAYEKPTYYFSEEFNRKKRIIVRGLTGFKYLKDDFGGSFRLFQFVSRKLLRWWIGPSLPVLYISNVFLLHNPVFVSFFILQNLFYVLAVVGAFLRRGNIQSKFLFVPFYFVMVNSAATVAIFTYLLGKRLSAWEKAETTRMVTSDENVVSRIHVVSGKTVGIDTPGTDNNSAFRNSSKKLDSFEKIT